MAAARPLSPRQERFVREYLIDLNGTQAVIRAGYSAKGADVQACRLLGDARIAAAIAAAQQKLASRQDVTLERIVAELAKIGFANMQDYMRVGSGGEPTLDFSNLTRDQAAALGEVTVETFIDGGGDDARAVRRVKFKLHDKRAALVDLGKHLGMFVERQAITVSVLDGMTQDELARIRQILADELAQRIAGGRREETQPEQAGQLPALH